LEKSEREFSKSWIVTGQIPVKAEAILWLTLVASKTENRTALSQTAEGITRLFWTGRLLLTRRRCLRFSMVATPVPQGATEVEKVLTSPALGHSALSQTLKALAEMYKQTFLFVDQVQLVQVVTSSNSRYQRGVKTSIQSLCRFKFHTLRDSPSHHPRTATRTILHQSSIRDMALLNV
jgi:hypothetical protein